MKPFHSVCRVPLRSWDIFQTILGYLWTIFHDMNCNVPLICTHQRHKILTSSVRLSFECTAYISVYRHASWTVSQLSVWWCSRHPCLHTRCGLLSMNPSFCIHSILQRSYPFHNYRLVRVCHFLVTQIVGGLCIMRAIFFIGYCINAEIHNTCTFHVLVLGVNRPSEFLFPIVPNTLLSD